MKNGLSNITIHDTEVEPGSSALIKIPVGRIPSGNEITIQVQVYRSERPGPTALILGGVHGDEVNGIEVVRSALAEGFFKNIKSGNVIIIPVLNIYGFINFSRDLPDGKDINRSFPGNQNGSLAARVAHILSKKILPLADFGIDFHTGGRGTYNFPQIRYTVNHSESIELAKVFAAPYLLAKKNIPKSLRKFSFEQEIPMLVYEGGENLRLDSLASQEGLIGLKRVLVAKGILEGNLAMKPFFHYGKTTWVRSPRAGMFSLVKRSGEAIQKGDLLGYIFDPYGFEQQPLIAKRGGHIIGHTNMPVVSQGDALFHIAFDELGK